MTQDILIIVEGGLIREIYGILPDVIIRVKDYDVEGCDERDLKRDRDGEPYCESVWTHDDSCDPPPRSAPDAQRPSQSSNQ